MAFYMGFQGGKKLATYQIKEAIENNQVVHLAKDKYAIGILIDWPWEPLRVQFMTPYKLAIFDKRGQPTIVDWQPGQPPQREVRNEKKKSKKSPDAKKNEPKR